MDAVWQSLAVAETSVAGPASPVGGLLFFPARTDQASTRRRYRLRGLAVALGPTAGRTTGAARDGRGGRSAGKRHPEDYPRFLGNGYWAEVSGVELETDWQANPPREIWRKKIGAGWSAFSIVGNYAVTQEQRDDKELVTCYRCADRRDRLDACRSGAVGSAGWRAWDTSAHGRLPTIHEGKVFAQGATGILNCLDARTGKLLWSHDTLREHGAVNVAWGKSCSPLVVDDRVVVSVGGKQDQSLVAYGIDSGEVGGRPASISRRTRLPSSPNWREFVRLCLSTRDMLPPGGLTMASHSGSMLAQRQWR